MSRRARNLAEGCSQSKAVLSPRPFTVLFLAVIGCSCPAAARAERVSEADFFSTVNDVLAELAPRSAHGAVAIRDTYRPYVDLLALNDFDAIATGLASGGLVPLPDPERFNIRVRLEGSSAIGEMDIANQERYVSARPAAIGCLLDVASRVTSGPIEVTSLARHLDYQELLRASNANATTEVPTHALGLAFDIAIVNTPLDTVLELEDVLREMSDAGDILFIAERQQLVFHVVPQPSRLGWYTDVYAHAMTGQPWPHRATDAGSLTSEVTTAVSSLQPLPAWAAEWWAADNVPVDLTVSVHADIDDDSHVTLLGELLSSTWRWIAPWTVVRA